MKDEQTTSQNNPYSQGGPVEYKLGARKPKIDRRTIRLSSFIRPALLPPLPESYDVDIQLGMSIPDGKDGNIKYGDCVIAARAKQTRRFEAFEQGTPPTITEDEIIAQYLKETGGPDVGLVVLDSLKRWRKEGWTFGGKEYNIYAFARVNWLDHTEVKYAIYLLSGIEVTIALPISAQTQLEVWEIVEGPDSAWGSWGFHQVYVPKWLPPNRIGPVCLTWGEPRQMTWEWWDKYVCEAHGIVDNKNKWQTNSPVDVEKLAALLIEVTNTPEAPTVESVTPSEGKQGETVKDIIIKGAGISVDIDVDFGGGVSVVGVHALSAVELKIDEVVITYDAEVGLRPVALSNGFGFGFKINAFNVLKGDSPPPPPAVPVAPSGLVLTAVSPTQVDMMWTDNSNNELGFHVERSSDIHFMGVLTIFKAGANVTTYSDTSVVAGTTYYYRVIAYNSAGDSPPSAVAMITTLPKPICPWLKYAKQQIRKQNIGG